MRGGTTETNGEAASPTPVLRVVSYLETTAPTAADRAPFSRSPAVEPLALHEDGPAVAAAAFEPVEPASKKSLGTDGERLLDALASAEAHARVLQGRLQDVQVELGLLRQTIGDESRIWSLGRYADRALRGGVIALLVVILALAVWARAVDYPLRVTSDTPTFVTLLKDMADHPFAAQSPFLVGGTGTQHATPYMQGLAFLARATGVDVEAPASAGRYLALVGIFVFAFALACVFVYARRRAGSTAAWASIPVLLTLFGPPHVIWASDLTLHGALYAGFFPQTLAIGTLLLTLLLLERRTILSLGGACALAATTMLVHPFTGVLLAVVATTEACRLAAARDRAAARAPIALTAGFAVGMLWPAYSLDRAFAETGLRGVVFIGLCAVAPLGALAIGPLVVGRSVARIVARMCSWLASSRVAFRLAIAGAVGTVLVAAWELLLVAMPPAESARLAIYWVDDRWRWPLLLVGGLVGLSGLARLAQRGQAGPALWFAGCFSIGTLGAIGLPLPVWYRFLLLCQIPLAVGVAAVVAGGRREAKTIGVVCATVVVALGIKVGTLLEAPPKVSYFGQELQSAWALGDAIPRGPGLVATDPSTAYFIPATTGRRVLTVDKGHVSSRRELAQSSAGYDLLRRYYAGGAGWWAAAKEMWSRGVRYVVVAKQTTLEPRHLEDFIWQTARLRTPAEREALGNYFYENNRIGELVYDSPEYALYRVDPRKLFRTGGSNR